MSGRTMDAENHRLLLTSSPAYNSFLKTTENDTLQIQPKYQVLFVYHVPESPRVRETPSPTSPSSTSSSPTSPSSTSSSPTSSSSIASSPKSPSLKSRVLRPTSHVLESQVPSSKSYVPSSTSQSPSARPTLSHCRVTVRQSIYHAN